MRPFPLLTLAAALALSAAALPRTASTQSTPVQRTPPVDPAMFAALRYRMIGPARGGRVTAVTGVPSQPFTFYMGATGGGVWKTDDAGANWRNVSDRFFGEGSIGAIDVAASDPNVVYVGTGSDGMRSNVSTGRGVYRSGDAGRTWTFVGLRDAGLIGAIRVDPRDANVAYVAAIGNAFKPNPERGVYRTRDGGKTWQRVLFVSDSTGAVDVELQPGSPNVLYASMWRGERKPWTIISGAREGGIYKSTDGGTTWAKLGGGLPNGLFGKSNLAVTAANPNRVYALIEAKPGSGLYRSEDAGATWALVTAQGSLITRPFYYTTLAADPTNADVVYAGAEGFFKSTDGGRTFRSMPTPHGDNHDLWVSPRDGNVMIQSNDGGAAVSLNGGRTWSTLYNQPTAEIYNVAVDSQWPYRVYGAQQDQGGTLIVPSLPVTAGAIDDPIQSWRQGPGCETGPVMPHPTNPDTVYGSCKGQFSRTSLRTGVEQQYWVGGQSLYGMPNKDLVYRFQRVSPMATSPHDSRIVYYGSQYLHRSLDGGQSWTRMSPDLTANDPRYRNTISGEPITIDVTGEEMYATLYAIAESKVAKGVIWTGANDGPVYVTRDNGATWTNVTPPTLPPGGRVQTVEPSPHRAGGAYVSVLRYQLGDFKPYIYATNDYGKSWRLLTPGDNGVPDDSPTRVVREDPSRAGLLYAGTEYGTFVSFDDGRRWQSFRQNMPAVPVTDFVIHRNDLVVATQGRAFWILDDLTPLHALADSVQRTRIAAAPAHLFAPREAVRLRYRASFGGEESDRASAVDPQYPPVGAMIDYVVSQAPEGVLSLEILDSAGTVLRRVTSGAAPAPAAGGGRFGGRAESLDASPGMHRYVWDYTVAGSTIAGTTTMNQAPIPGGGPAVPPGRFTVRLTLRGAGTSASQWTMTQPLVVKIDPRLARDGITTAVLREQFAHNQRVRALVAETNALVERVRSERARLAAGGASDTLTGVQALESLLVTPPVRYSRPGLQAQVQYLAGLTSQADQKIGRDAVERYQQLRREVDAAQAEARRWIGAAR